jgi:hypothetical protein
MDLRSILAQAVELLLCKLKSKVQTPVSSKKKKNASKNTHFLKHMDVYYIHPYEALPLWH